MAATCIQTALHSTEQKSTSIRLNQICLISISISRMNKLSQSYAPTVLRAQGSPLQ